jgi:hypothetical protein
MRLLAIAATLAALLAFAPHARAADTVCNSYVTGPGTITGNVVVPSGTTCRLGWVPPSTTACCNPPPPPGYGPVHVTGNVTVASGASVILGLNSTVDGNLQATGCGYVELVSEGNEEVFGNIQVTNCNGGSTPGQPAFLSTGTGSRIDGSLQCHNNTGPCILESAFVGANVEIIQNVNPSGSQQQKLESNQILGNLQITNNVTPGSPAKITSNQVAGNLQCQSNIPLPTGSGNVAGNEGGQCVGY